MAGVHPYLQTDFVAMAHRGGSLLPGNVGVENTVAAFRRAVAIGYRFLETDVHVSADGQLVAIHDAVLDRVSDGHGTVAQHTWDELSRMRIGGTEPIARLDDLLEAFPEQCFNIDLKVDAAVPLLAAAISRHHAEERVCVASFSDARLRHFRDLTRGRVLTAAGRSAIAWTALVPVLPRYVNSPGRVLQVPVSHQVGPMRLPIVHPQMLRTAHARGMKVHVWTVNDPIEMRRLIELGVDGIISDAIDVLRQVATETGRWR